MNIVVIGAGGVGGYFGGRLAKAGFNVTFLVRGKHLEAIRDNGLQVKSIYGDFLVRPDVTNTINELKTPDLIMLGVKSWQIETVAKQIKPILVKDSMVLPLQNGADNADKLLSVLDRENVLAGLSRIYSKIEAPGIINHMGFEPHIVFGEYTDEKTKRVKKLKETFDIAGIKNDISENIHLDIWRKFLFITTISGIGGLTRSVFGVMREDPYVRQMIIDTANEIRSVANAKRISLTDNDVNKAIASIDGIDYNTTASAQRDIMEGRPSELENFNGYIVKQGKELGVETPVNAFIYHNLMPQERKARNL